MNLLLGSLYENTSSSIRNTQKTYSAKKRYLSLCSGIKVDTKFILVGDRPGPSAPTAENYHHTPFYSIKHCSGWLNMQLELHAINEDDLIWINAAAANGSPTDPKLIEDVNAKVVALGGNAVKWLKLHGFSFIETYHPQYWKRFKSKEQYPRFGILSA